MYAMVCRYRDVRVGMSVYIGTHWYVGVDMYALVCRFRDVRFGMSM